jgi:alpha-N-acetylglucosaminidase
MQINEHYFKGIESFLSVADTYKDNELYVIDAVQYAALYLAAKADYALKAANWAIVAGDTAKAEELTSQLTDMLVEMDKLLESHPILRIQRWMDMAAESATSPEEAAAFQKEVKRLVSTWSGPSLKDYSARVWSGLVRDFYVPRLEYYYSKAIKGELADMVTFENQYHYGTAYGTADDVCPAGETPVSVIEQFENPLAAAAELVRKYSAVDYNDKAFNPYAPAREVAYWCPQDFEGKSKKRLYMTIMATDFAKMNGLMITNARGENVKISKVEFKSGPKWFGVFDLDQKIRDAEQLHLLCGCGLGVIRNTKMLVCKTGDATPARCAGQEADLHQVRLVNVLQRHGFLAYGCRKRVKAHGATVVKLDNGGKHATVEIVQPQRIDLQTG